MNVEQGSSGYIPKERQIPIQPESVGERLTERTIRGLNKIRHVGPLLVAMLAANIGLVGAAKTTDSHEPEVRPQVMVDSIQNGGFETQDPVDPSKPQHWNPDGTQPPVYNYQNGTSHDGLSSVGVQYYGTGGLCSMDTNSWTSNNFAVDPDKTYTKSFWSEYVLVSDPNVEVGPVTRVYWKDSQGNAVGTPDVFQPNYTVGAGNWERFTKVYGPELIPDSATQASITVGINGITFEQGCSTYATTNYDEVTFTSQAPASVGGIAEMPNLQPATTVSHSSRNMTVEFVLAGAAALAGTIAVAETVRRRNRNG